MAQKHNPSHHFAKTCDALDLAAMRRQLQEIERNIQQAEQGNTDVAAIQKRCDKLQQDSIEARSVIAHKQLHAQEHLSHVTKRTQEIDQVIKKLKEAESADVCFIMDCTNSMRKYIDQVKEYIFKTVELLKIRFPSLNMRFAFVGYRDLNLTPDKQFSILDFVHVEQFHEFVSNVECDYGGDICEDVLGGLKKVTELQWKQPVRIMIHVGDAPAHGQRYHDLSETHDYYLTNDHDGSIGYSYIQELIELNVTYYFGRLTKHTDKMIEQFRKYAEEKMSIEEVDVNKFDNLLPFIVESISQSISSTTASLLKRHAEDETATKSDQRKIIFDKTKPFWPNIKCQWVKVIKYDCNQNLQCAAISQSWNIKITENPFSEGAIRLAYYGLMEYKDKWEEAVFKEYTRNTRGANAKDKYLEDLECQAIADYLAQEFNKLSKLENLTVYVKKIKFIMTKLVFIRIEAGKFRNMSMERYIEGSYKKYSNNAGFVDYKDPEYTLQAFSHWTYERTDGYLMVVDLQGIITGGDEKFLLTDPCIHSTDVLRFGRTNLGKEGMKRFFQTHICNVICHALKLKPNKYQPDITSAKYDLYFTNKANRTVFT